MSWIQQGTPGFALSYFIIQCTLKDLAMKSGHYLKSVSTPYAISIQITLRHFNPNYFLKLQPLHPSSAPHLR